MASPANVDLSLGLLRRWRTDWTVYGAKRCELTAHIPLTATSNSLDERARALAVLVVALVADLEEDFGAPISGEVIRRLYARLDCSDGCGGASTGG